jgi:hypothetical protein
VTLTIEHEKVISLEKEDSQRFYDDQTKREEEESSAIEQLEILKKKRHEDQKKRIHSEQELREEKVELFHKAEAIWTKEDEQIHYFNEQEHLKNVDSEKIRLADNERRHQEHEEYFKSLLEKVDAHEKFEFIKL